MNMNGKWRVLVVLGILCSYASYPTAVLGDEHPATGQPAPVTHITLRFDGIYQSEKRGDSYKYVRFYEDGSIIAVTSTGTPKQVARWFTRSHEGVSHGTYMIAGTRIVFSSRSHVGVVDYDGRFASDHITFQIYSHINQKRSTHKYTFVAEAVR